MIESKRKVRITNKQLIAFWAQKEGAAHEDWELPREWKAVRDLDFFGIKEPASVRTLQKITNTVLYVADEFLIKLTPDLVARKHVEWIRNLKHDEVTIEGYYLFIREAP